MPTTPPGADPEPAHPHPSNLPRITLLAGGIGGARFTRGLLGHLGARADAHSTGLAEVTVRAVAKQAGMSERTVFRYFAAREEFLGAIVQFTSADSEYLSENGQPVRPRNHLPALNSRDGHARTFAVAAGASEFFLSQSLLFPE